MCTSLDLHRIVVAVVLGAAVVVMRVLAALLVGWEQAKDGCVVAVTSHYDHHSSCSLLLRLPRQEWQKASIQQKSRKLRRMNKQQQQRKHQGRKNRCVLLLRLSALQQPLVIQIADTLPQLVSIENWLEIYVFRIWTISTCR